MTDECGPLLARTSSDRRASKYPNQILAFYGYSIATGIYSTVALVLFLPVLLEDLARQHGRLDRDRSLSCGPAGQDSCVVNFLGTWIDTASFSLVVSGISLAAQVVVLISIGDYADHISTRSFLILLSSFGGSISGILFFAISPTSPWWWTAAFLALIGNVCFGICLVCLNSSLAAVTRVSRPVIKAENNLENSEGKDKEEAQGLYDKAFAKTTAAISAQAFAAGNAAGLAVLGIAYIPITKMGESTASLRIAIGVAGLCWFLFGAAASWFNRRNLRADNEPYYRFSIVEGWRGLYYIVRDATKLQQNFRFLIAWFILSDGFAAITTALLLYGKTAIHMTPSQITLIGIIAPLCGIAANLVLPRLASRFNIASIDMLTTVCCAAILAPFYVLLSYIPALREAGGFGSFSTSAEIFFFVAYFGVIAGAFESYARAIYSELIPKRQETRFFSLFSITNKGSAFLGPLLVALCNQWTGSLRSAFVFLLITLIIPIPLLFSLDIAQGKRDAAAFAYARRDQKGEE